MATYTGIKGQDIQVVSSDPSPLIPGQIWYNSTSNTFKAAVQEAGGPAAWTAGGALGTARKSLAGAGINTSALAFGGNGPSACTESYNGSAWTTVGAMATARRELAGTGASNTAALGFGGYTTVAVACTESYNAALATCTKTLTIS